MTDLIVEVMGQAAALSFINPGYIRRRAMQTLLRIL